MPKTGYVYILASRPHGAIYIGVTSDLPKRIYEHKDGLIDGFSKRYRTDDLVYFEAYDDISEAILRERRMKKWLRAWKVELIESQNPEWRDLSPEL